MRCIGLPTLLVAAVGVCLTASACRQDNGRCWDAEYPIVFADEFERGRFSFSVFDLGLGAWEMTDRSAWRLSDDGNRSVLELFGESRYQPPVRSPLNIAWIRDVEVSSFMLEVEMRSTHEPYDHRDLCLFWGARSPSRFYYAHLASRADENANSIFLVNDAARVSIASFRTEATPWDDEYHVVRVERDAEDGDIRVFFNGQPEPVMTARDKTFTSGRVGIGSFDDTGRFDNVMLFGERVPPAYTSESAVRVSPAN